MPSSPADPADPADAAGPGRSTGALSGRVVVTTRATPGRLDALLERHGATVVHVPLIAIDEPADGGAALRQALAHLPRAAWLVVTSQHGAARVGAAAAIVASVRLAAVGTRTAEVLAARSGRPVDLVPERHTAADLLAAFPDPGQPGEVVVLALGDLAAADLADGLRARAYEVVAATAYRTTARQPGDVERHAALSADAVTFASGSAVTAWINQFGPQAPPVFLIGPTAAEAAQSAGLPVTATATPHTLEALVATLIHHFHE